MTSTRSWSLTPHSARSRSSSIRRKPRSRPTNFLKYVDDGFYDNLIFHRVIPRFMIQGGGFDATMREKSDGQHGKIKNESGNGLSNVPGTIAMARTTDPNSAQNQFFINVDDNSQARHRRRRLRRLRQGDRRHGRGRQDRQGEDGEPAVGMDDVPVEPVIIKTARRKAKK